MQAFYFICFLVVVNIHHSLLCMPLLIQTVHIVSSLCHYFLAFFSFASGFGEHTSVGLVFILHFLPLNWDCILFFSFFLETICYLEPFSTNARHITLETVVHRKGPSDTWFFFKNYIDNFHERKREHLAYITFFQM